MSPGGDAGTQAPSVLWCHSLCPVASKVAAQGKLRVDHAWETFLGEVEVMRASLPPISTSWLTLGQGAGEWGLMGGPKETLGMSGAAGWPSPSLCPQSEATACHTAGGAGQLGDLARNFGGVWALSSGQPGATNRLNQGSALG